MTWSKRFVNRQGRGEVLAEIGLLRWSAVLLVDGSVAAQRNGLIFPGRIQISALGYAAEVFLDDNGQPDCIWTSPRLPTAPDLTWYR
jgi:hypothetical protein